MRRLALAALASGLVVWLAWPVAPLPARFALTQCKVQPLVDAATGVAIAGAEDLAIGPDGALIVAARDRLGVGPSGLWRVKALDTGRATRVAGLEGVAPQGIAIQGDRLAVIDRAVPAVRIGRLAPEFNEEARLTDPAYCRANDLAFDGDRVLVTLDRADCGASLRDLAPWGATGRLVQAGGPVLRDALAFANGVAVPGGAVWVAETRAARAGPVGGAIALPGGPDNLTVDGDGLLAALHPDLLRLALYRAGWSGSAPSRIVRITDAGVEVLVDDPGGAVFSAATVAVWLGDRLVAGSVRAPGLMVCAP